LNLIKLFLIIKKHFNYFISFIIINKNLKKEKKFYFFIMNPIEKELDVFKYLISKYCSKENQKDIIRRAKGPLINKICECILNIINGKIKISSQDLEKLKPYKNLFRKLLVKSTGLREKKRLINQKGGFLQILIPAIISGLASIISSAISSKSE